MRKKPELLISAASIEQIQRYLNAGATAFLIGEATYGMRLPGDFTLEQIQQATQLAHHNGAKIYVAVNNVLDNHTIATLPAYLESLQTIGVDAIVFGDPAVLMTARVSAPNLALHWNAEMTSTNFATANYWGKRGATRFVLARELNMEQVLEVKANTTLAIQVHVHGLTNIYHSKRPLVENYSQFLQGKSVIDAKATGMFLIETERPLERFPIYEDMNGTHIMSSDDVCILEYLHELMAVDIDSFKIEPLLKSPEYNEIVVRAYRTAIDAYYENPDTYEFNEEWLAPVQAKQQEEVPDRELSFGFFYKEQVY